MTAVNLNKFRKAKARAEKPAKAAANRAKFGRTKAEKAKDADAEARRNNILNQTHKDRSED